MVVLTRFCSVGFYTLCLFVGLASRDKVEWHNYKYTQENGRDLITLKISDFKGITYKFEIKLKSAHLDTCKFSYK